jgi:hypothetical protein
MFKYFCFLGTVILPWLDSGFCWGSRGEMALLDLLPLIHKVVFLVFVLNCYWVVTLMGFNVLH